MLLRVALPLALVFFGSFSSVFAEDPKTSVSQALKGLNQKTRFARGLEDQCVDVYEDLEMRARKAGQDYLHNDVANWHHVKNQVVRSCFDSMIHAIRLSMETEETSIKDNF